MTIGESFKFAINKSFQYITFRCRETESIKKTLNTNIHGTSVQILPPIEKIEVKKMDDTHDNIKIIYDDYVIEGVITWRPCSNESCFVFIKFE